MRIYAFMALIGMGGVARASFDLMLLGDNTTAGSERVVRYDPVNRVQLGSFGSGFLNSSILDIEVDQVGGRAFVLTANGIRVFNYNTGAFLAAMSFAGYNDMSYDASLNRLGFGQGSGSGSSPSRLYNADTLVEIGSLTNRFVSTAPLRRVGTSWYACYGLSGANVAALRYSIAGGSQIGTDVTGIVWANLNAPREAIFTSDNRLLGIGVDTNANTTSLWSVPTDVNGYVAGIGVGAISTASTNAAISNGHGDLAYILMGSTLTSYHTGMNAILGTQSLAFSSNIRGMAVVVAPEPGTMLALAGGIGALLRRRRRA